MSAALEALGQLEDAGIEVTVLEGQLRLRGPKPPLSLLAEARMHKAAIIRLCQERMEHDEAEAVAMAEHFAAPASPSLPSPDPLTQGLLQGYRTHVERRQG